MSFYSTEQISALLSAQIGAELGSLENTIFLAPNPRTQKSALFIRINNPPIPQYKGERTIFGKGLRVIHHLHRYLGYMLEQHDLSDFAVTEAKTPASANFGNTFTLPADHVKVICETMKSMTSSQCDGYIAEMVKMNNANRRR